MIVRKKSKRKPTDISRTSNVTLSIIVGIVAVVCIYPIILMFMISLSAEKSIVMNGFNFFPAHYSLEAYRYLFKIGSQLLTSYMITIIVTVGGTILSVCLITLYAYGISRDDFKYRKFFTFFALFPLLFNAGFVATYLINSQLLGFTNSFLGLIIPLAISPFLILIMRTYFKTTIPSALIEAARIDGAGEFRIFYKIVVPLSKPGIATISLLQAVAYWNDWWDPLLYIDKPSMTPVQLMLQKTQANMQFIINNSSSMSTNSIELLKHMPTQTAIFAILVLATIPILCTYPFFQKYVVSGMTVGGVKD